MKAPVNYEVSMNEDCSVSRVPESIQACSMRSHSVNQTKTSTQNYTKDTFMESPSYSEQKGPLKANKALSKFFLRSRCPSIKGTDSSILKGSSTQEALLASRASPSDQSFETKEYFGLLKRNMGVFSELKKLPTPLSISFGRPVQKAHSAFTKKFSLPKFASSKLIKIRKEKSVHQSQAAVSLLGQTGNIRIVDNLLSKLGLTITTPHFEGVPEDRDDQNDSGKFADLCELNQPFEADLEAFVGSSQNQRIAGEGRLPEKEGEKRACQEPLKRSGGGNLRPQLNRVPCEPAPSKEPEQKTDKDAAKKRFKTINASGVYHSRK